MRTTFRPLVPFAFCLILSEITPLYQKYLFSQPTAFMGGPLNGDLYISRPLFVAAAYYAAVFALLNRYPNGTHTQIISQTRLRCLTALVVVGSVAALSFGVTSYWYATQSGVTVYPG